ncbi:MAG: nucleotide exchange factor GrpE, partial [Luteimonas sp.]|nr:nucleotide exchange factor GrpE [Luteimonas sp.]
ANVPSSGNAADAVADDDAAEQDQMEALREALVQKSEEAERFRDQALRAAADADNARKRAQREVDAARKFALEKFCRELLAVRDSLDMGLKAGAEDSADLGTVVEGMELTGRMLATAMEKFGVEVVNPQGEAFDPELHEAVSVQETDAQPPNSVVTVIQKGYTLNGRVLRAAMVVVAQAPNGKA